MPELVKRIVDFLNEAKDKYPCEVDCNGEITYANGNDSTPFDWEVNNRLCEFGWGVPDGSVWAFKCHAHRNGTVTIYCYPNGEAKPVDTLEKELFTENEMEQLYDIMYNSTDRCGIYDVTLDEIEWKYE